MNFMKQQMLGYIQNIIPAGVAFLAFLTPLFFGPWTQDPFEFNKTVLIMATAAVLFTLWLLRLTLAGRITFRKTRLDLPLFILLLSLVGAAFFSPNRLLSFTRTEFWLWVSLILLYFTYTNNRNKTYETHKTHETHGGGPTFNTDTAIIRSLKTSGGLLALISLLNLVGLFKLPQLSFILQKGFTPAGNVATLDLFLITLLVLELGRLKNFFLNADAAASGETYETHKTHEPRGLKFGDSFYSSVYLSLLILAIITVNPLTTPEAKSTSPDLKVSWDVASEVIKDRPLFGAGPGLYAEAFAFNKPFSLNSSSDWNTIFAASGSTLLQTLSTAGLAGGLALVLLFSVSTVASLVKIKDGLEILPTATVVLTGAAFLTALNGATLLLLFLLLALGNPSSTESYLAIYETHETRLRSLLPAVFTLPLTLAALIGLFGLWRIFSAEVTYKSALNLLAQNAPLIPVYSAFAKTGELNPLDPRYRISFSSLSLSAAQTIIENANAKKENLISQDQEFVKSLITQARREADAAVALNPLSFETYENRANFFKRISGFAADAADLSVEDYRTAIGKNPNSPVLRARLAAVLRDVKKDLEGAKKSLLQAISLKPDYAEARLELARTYTALDKKDLALNEYKKAEKLAEEQEKDSGERALLELIRAERMNFEKAGTETE